MVLGPAFRCAPATRNPEFDYSSATPQEIFEIMSARAESIDYDNFKAAIAATPGQRHKLDAYHRVWSTLAAIGNTPIR